MMTNDVSRFFLINACLLCAFSTCLLAASIVVYDDGRLAIAQCANDDCPTADWFQTFSVLLRAPFDDLNQIFLTLPAPLPGVTKTLIIIYEICFMMVRRSGE